MIGDPDVRLIEDPIRILRGIRLSPNDSFCSRHRSSARHEKLTRKTLTTTALPRRREEFLKFLPPRRPSATVYHGHDFGVIDFVLPTLAECLNNPDPT